MKPNPKCLLKVTHTMRPGVTLELTWSHVGFKYLGASNPQLPEYFKSLVETGKVKIYEKNMDEYLQLEVIKGQSITLEESK